MYIMLCSRFFRYTCSIHVLVIVLGPGAFSHFGWSISASAVRLKSKLCGSAPWYWLRAPSAGRASNLPPCSRNLFGRVLWFLFIFLMRNKGEREIRRWFASLKGSGAISEMFQLRQDSGEQTVLRVPWSNWTCTAHALDMHIGTAGEISRFVLHWDWSMILIIAQEMLRISWNDPCFNV